jgi:hypothetical protein
MPAQAEKRRITNGIMKVVAVILVFILVLFSPPQWKSDHLRNACGRAKQ